jgi:hypothetical protein
MNLPAQGSQPSLSIRPSRISAKPQLALFLSNWALFAVCRPELGSKDGEYFSIELLWKSDAVAGGEGERGGERAARGAPGDGQASGVDAELPGVASGPAQRHVAVVEGSGVFVLGARR